jgi:hypothetical protein
MGTIGQDVADAVVLSWLAADPQREVLRRESESVRMALDLLRTAVFPAQFGMLAQWLGPRSARAVLAATLDSLELDKGT